MWYRSYYYDEESGFYYWQSRYYDPQMGRFINADEADILELTSRDINGANLYSYRGDDPVNNIDPSGYKTYNIEGIYVYTFYKINGFWLYPHKKLLSTWYCRYFVGKFFKKASNGKRNYTFHQKNGNVIGLERAAAEVYAPAYLRPFM